jgi:hypothetical protein
MLVNVDGMFQSMIEHGENHKTLTINLGPFSLSEAEPYGVATAILLALHEGRGRRKPLVVDSKATLQEPSTSSPSTKLSDDNNLLLI